MHTCIHICKIIHTREEDLLLIFTNAYIHTCIHTHIYTNIHTYIQTDIPTHTYIRYMRSDLLLIFTNATAARGKFNVFDFIFLLIAKLNLVHFCINLYVSFCESNGLVSFGKEPNYYRSISLKRPNTLSRFASHCARQFVSTCVTFCIPLCALTCKSNNPVSFELQLNTYMASFLKKPDTLSRFASGCAHQLARAMRCKRLVGSLNF